MANSAVCHQNIQTLDIWSFRWTTMIMKWEYEWLTSYLNIIVTTLGLSSTPPGVFFIMLPVCWLCKVVFCSLSWIGHPDPAEHVYLCPDWSAILATWSPSPLPHHLYSWLVGSGILSPLLAPSAHLRHLGGCDCLWAARHCFAMCSVTWDCETLNLSLGCD